MYCTGEHLCPIPVSQRAVTSRMRGKKLIWFLPASALCFQCQTSCIKAVDLMAFHRDKMQEYQCRRFLADTIVEDSKSLQKRDDSSLLMDEGSSKYNDWLARSSTLEDIYRHYEQEAAADAPVGSSVSSDGYGGDVTGYAMVPNKAPAESTGYGVGTSYGVPQYHPSPSSKAVGISSDKGMKLNDLFQLALTAIAFLAFGTFIIEVIMCIMGFEMAKNKMNVVIMTPNEPLLQANPNHYYKEEEVRRARSLQQSLKMQTLQAMAEKATISLDALKDLPTDSGRQLETALCITASLSRVFNGTARLWPPLWSFGMSWVGGRGSGTLKYLTATVRGLAGSNCAY